MTRRPPWWAPCLARQRQVTKRASHQCVGPGQAGGATARRRWVIAAWVLGCRARSIRFVRRRLRTRVLTRTHDRRLGLSLPYLYASRAQLERPRALRSLAGGVSPTTHHWWPSASRLPVRRASSHGRVSRNGPLGNRTAVRRRPPTPTPSDPDTLRPHWAGRPLLRGLRSGLGVAVPSSLPAPDIWVALCGCPQAGRAPEPCPQISWEAV